MPYAAIVLDPNVVSAGVRLVIQRRIEPNLRDIRRMLEYPKVPGGDEPGFNLTAAPELCSVIGGLSRIFFSTTKADGEGFRNAARRYPLSDEPSTAICNSEDFATELYKVYRCNLVHSLGLNVEWSAASRRWEIVELPILRKVTRVDRLPLAEARLAELDLPTGRPAWLPATLSADGGVVRLNTEAFYWGVRRLVRTLAEDRTLSADAEKFAKPWFERSCALPSGHAVMSSAPVIVQTTDTLHGTLGPVSAVGSQWSGKP